MYPSMDETHLGDHTERLVRSLGFMVYVMGQLEVSAGGLLARMMKPTPYEDALGEVAARDLRWQLREMKRIAEQRPASEERRRFLSTVDAIQRANKRRHELVHATYEGRADDDPNDAVERWKWERGTAVLGTHEYISPDDIWNFAQRVQELHHELVGHVPFLHECRLSP